METLFQLRLLLSVSWPHICSATLLLSKRGANPFAANYGIRRSQIRRYAAKRKYIMVFGVFDLSNRLSNILRYDRVPDRTVDVQSRMLTILR